MDLWALRLQRALPQLYPTNSSRAPSGGPGNELPAWLEGLGRWILEDPTRFFAIVVSVTVALTALFIILSTVSRAALSESVAALRRGERCRFGSTLRAGLGLFWRLLGLRALFLLMTLAVSLVLFAPPAAFLLLYVPSPTYPPRGFPVGALIAAFLVFLLAGLLLLLVSIPIFIVAQLATRELVVGDRGVFGAFGGGFWLFRQNFGRSLLTWIIQFALAVGTGIALLVVLGILGILLFGPAIFLFATERTTAAVVSGIVGGLILLIPACVLAGAVGTFHHAYWTLAYLRLVSRDVPEPQPAS